MRQMESSLSSREKIFKERINGLEEQVDVLKDQLSKEMRRRQTFIAGLTQKTVLDSKVTNYLDELWSTFSIFYLYSQRG
jgi:hypothetical protein